MSTFPPTKKKTSNYQKKKAGGRLTNDPETSEVPSSHGPVSNPSSPLGSYSRVSSDGLSLEPKGRLDLAREVDGRSQHDEISNNVR